MTKNRPFGLELEGPARLWARPDTVELAVLREDARRSGEKQGKPIPHSDEDSDENEGGEAINETKTSRHIRV